MEKIPYGDELYRNENEQTFHSRKENSNNCHLNDLVMINNQRGSYFFSSADNGSGESPVFKIRFCFKLMLIIQNFRITQHIWCSIINVQTFV